MAIVKRLVKGSALTHAELDGNFTDLDTRVGTLESTTDSDSQTLTLVGTDLSISDGNTVDLSGLGGGGGGSGLSSVVDDTTPQLGGDLDVNGKTITAASLNVAINPPAGGFLHLGFGTADAHSVRMYDMYAFPKAVPNTGDVLTAGANSYELEWAAPTGGGAQGPQGPQGPAGTVDTNSDLDMNGNKVLFGNVYSQLADLPSASTYHGMFAHVHATGKGYFAHGGNWIELANNSDVPTDLTDLSISDGTNGQVLTTDGSGNFSFTTVSGGGGTLESRTTVVATTSSIADGASEDVDVTGFKGYMLMKIETDGAAWVRVYASNAARTADAGRSEGTDPAADAGVIAEVITSSAQTILISPGAYGFNDDNPVTANIATRITNKTGSTGVVTATLHVLQLEA